MGYVFLALALMAGATKGYCGKKTSGFVSGFRDSMLANMIRMLLCIAIGMVLILAGAIGNLIDSMFYGMIFTQSTPLTVATFGEGYSTFLMGKVVDMFHFPLFQWNNVPNCLAACPALTKSGIMPF